MLPAAPGIADEYCITIASLTVDAVSSSTRKSICSSPEVKVAVAPFGTVDETYTTMNFAVDGTPPDGVNVCAPPVPAVEIVVSVDADPVNVNTPVPSRPEPPELLALLELAALSLLFEQAAITKRIDVIRISIFLKSFIFPPNQ